MTTISIHILQDERPGGARQAGRRRDPLQRRRARRPEARGLRRLEEPRGPGRGRLLPVAPVRGARRAAELLAAAVGGEAGGAGPSCGPGSAGLRPARETRSGEHHELDPNAMCGRPERERARARRGQWSSQASQRDWVQTRHRSVPAPRTHEVGPAFERHYRIGELAEMWKLGRETVRLLIKDEVGVIKIRLGRKKVQTAYSVPESVARRIHTRLLNSR